MSQAMIRGVMDESGEQFVAYFLPVEETLNKRREDFANNIPYQDDEEYEYKMAREYNWNVKSKASKGYEENYFFVVRHDGVYYNELETRVRLSKRRQKVGQAPSNTRLMVKHRPMKANEFKMQRYRERQLEPPGEDDEELEIEEEPEEMEQDPNESQAESDQDQEQSVKAKESDNENNDGRASNQSKASSRSPKNRNQPLDLDRGPFLNPDHNRNLDPGQDRNPNPDRGHALLLDQFLVRNLNLDPVQNRSPRRDLLQNRRLAPNSDQKAGLLRDQKLLDHGRNRNLYLDHGLALDQNPNRVLDQVLPPKVSKACLFIWNDNLYTTYASFSC
ncbi:hypothetical protein HUJ04_008227 [Dendroctonus ponderosae]|uniref:RNA polymerase II-associated factor 1 homolog n=1 Tax=Dendroctonus ponderosae TaxID=77166 RepID=A0AAR5QGL0_DENPD|nr:hypothetical protein HUJ04_008227 [Dendroctonus ponderosae]